MAKKELYFDEIKVGDKGVSPTYTFTEERINAYAELTGDFTPVHVDEEYARTSEFGRCIVASPLTVAMMVGMSVTDVSQKAIANLGWREIRMTAPLYAGDTLYAESEVIAKRESRSRPTAGLVTVRTTGLNQDGVAVCSFERTVLVPKRGADGAGETGRY